MNPTEELIEAIEEKEYKHISVSTGEATPSGVIQVFDVKDVLSEHLPKIMKKTIQEYIKWFWSQDGTIKPPIEVFLATQQATPDPGTGKSGDSRTGIADNQPEKGESP